MSSTQTQPTEPALPLVVHVGFAGSRQLFTPTDGEQTREHDESLVGELVRHLRSLPEKLDLSSSHFLCGTSQCAIGADALFTRACQNAGIPQRIFLPQHRQEFLHASGSRGPDFSDAQREETASLLDSPHIIQEQVVSDAAARGDRFHDVNLEIVRTSDVIVCLLRAPQGAPSGKPGGTNELIALAQRRGVPVLELRLELSGSGPRVTPTWHGLDEFRKPAVPHTLAGTTLERGADDELPEIGDYCAALKSLASKQANWQRKFFTGAAATIIGAHVLATIIAVVALKLHTPIIPWLLGIELLLLGCGLGMHYYLHRKHALGVWAMSRLAAEVARSVGALGTAHIHLRYLFALPFPAALRPLLRTINVLHLSSTKAKPADSWESSRVSYVERRLTSSDQKAQIPYNEGALAEAKRGLAIAKWTFYGASGMAILATFTKLLAICHCLPLAPSLEGIVASWAGALAIVLPVIAVAALSLAAGFDLEARAHTTEETLEFLHAQTALLKDASSVREYHRLLLVTESRLLGETVNWYARRVFVGVT